MKKTLYLFFIFSIISNTPFSQSIDANFSQKKMWKDLKVFKEIRLKANSGLYKYRTKKQIDSIYSWAEQEINNLSTYRDFYNLISILTDYEGSLHNNTLFPQKRFETVKTEKSGYFPFPVKIIAHKVYLNFQIDNIPLGAEIISINNQKITDIIPNMYKFYTTDGINKTGKQIGINRSFSKYYRYLYGLENDFKITYKTKDSDVKKSVVVKSVGYSDYLKNFKNRHSKVFDRLQYNRPNKNEIYTYNQINKNTGILTINSFSIGDNEKSIEHNLYKKWLDSIFVNIKKTTIKNLIVDVRNNGGGTDPNDVITYSYLTSRKFQESKKVWISFNKIPLLRYYNSSIPTFLRPFGVGKFNRYFQKRFPNEKNGKYFISKETNEMKVRTPNKNAFTQNIYLLISPKVASAGSLFAAMLAGNENTTTIGEETNGGYYGHNGHTGFEYVLPKSKIVTEFSIDNIEQDVPKKSNQFYNRGIIPDYTITQTFEDFLNNVDTQMNFALELINK
ncbi:S41 family peptidase [Aquimarina rhabdastrellae]